MMEGSKQVSYEMDSIANMTTAVNTNVRNMTEKTDAISNYSKQAQTCVEKNVDSIHSSSRSCIDLLVCLLGIVSPP